MAAHPPQTLSTRENVKLGEKGIEGQKTDSSAASGAIDCGNLVSRTADSIILLCQRSTGTK